jgi:hypothetical protein
VRRTSAGQRGRSTPTLGVELRLGVGADPGDLGDDLVQRRGHPLVDGHGVFVPPALDHVGPVAVPLQLLEQLLLGDPGHHRRVGDLVAVEVQDRQHGAVVDRVDELVRLPRPGQRAGLGLPSPITQATSRSGLSKAAPYACESA